MRINENLSKVHEHIDFLIGKLYNENNEYEKKRSVSKISEIRRKIGFRKFDLSERYVLWIRKKNKRGKL